MMATVVGWMVLLPLTVWAAAAVFFDFRIVAWRRPFAVIYTALMVIIAVVIGNRWLAMGLVLTGFVAVVVWWFSLRPENHGHWQPNVMRRAWAEVSGDHVLIHNLRHSEYRSEVDYTPHWETRTANLAAICGVDVFLTYWGSQWIAHPIVSFQFGDVDHVAISIEARRAVGEKYSAIRGLFRQYELIYIVSDERDVVRLRTNYRKGESVYLFRTTATPQQARILFLEYLRRVNRVHDRPEWYNAVTNNCTTNISVILAAASGRRPHWDWRILLNGRADEMMYEHGELAGTESFAGLKTRALINSAAQAADGADDFSRRIRWGRPGFDAEAGPAIAISTGTR